MKRLLIIVFFVVIALYALFQARFLILGPRITVETPVDNALVDVGVILVSGTARNVSSLALNDRSISVDTEGRFEEKLAVNQGINIMKVTAKDRFGRQSEKLVRVVAK